MTTARAAVLHGTGEPFVLEEVELDELRADEVLVRVVASGLCHTDLAVQHGDLPVTFPLVVGHEGSGIVERVGAAVTTFSPGDRVAASFTSCGQCANCLEGRTSYCLDFMRLNFGGARADGSTTATSADGAVLHAAFFGQSSFATFLIASTRNLVAVPDDVPLELAGPLGCGVQTGAGTVLNSLALPAGSSLVVSGAGAVGLSAVMAAKAAGAATIIATDVLPGRLALARELGATHTIDARSEDVVSGVLECTDGLGAAYAVDTTGIAAVIEDVISATRFGARIALVGVGAPGSRLALGLASASGRTLIGAIEGDAVPQTFIPRLIALHREGKFPFDRLMTTYPFDDIARAVEETLSGRCVKAVLTMS